MFPNRQPKRTVPEPQKPPQHGTTQTRRDESENLTSFRLRIISVTAGILAFGVLGYAIYGPWFAVRSVRVTGTRELAPQSVKAVTEYYLRGWRFGLVPNDNLWLLSRRRLADHIAEKIRTRLSIEEVRVVKKNRHDLEVVIVERSPIAVWAAGDHRGSIDRTGIIINTVESTDGLPVLVDSGAKSFAIGDQVFTDQAMRGWIILNDAFKASSLSVENYLIPVPTCPTKIVEPTDQGTNTNRGSVVNGNTNTETNANESDELATINGVINDNVNTSVPMVVPTDCDLVALAKASQEIHAKLKDGPLVLFDRHQDLALAVQTVQRLIANPDNNGASYIDIRFQERVYIK